MGNFELTNTTWAEFRANIAADHFTEIGCEVKLPDDAYCFIPLSALAGVCNDAPNESALVNLENGWVKCYAHYRWWYWDTTKVNQFYPELCDRYIKSMSCHRIPNNEYQNEYHLTWMLEKIKLDESMSLTKKHRWLGYVQGVLAVVGTINVEEEREFTRSIFNGA